MKDLDRQLKAMGTKEGAHSFGEVFIHQMIETIEFVLGTVSNTPEIRKISPPSAENLKKSHVFQFLFCTSGTDPDATASDRSDESRAFDFLVALPDYPDYLRLVRCAHLIDHDAIGQRWRCTKCICDKKIILRHKNGLRFRNSSPQCLFHA